MQQLAITDRPINLKDVFGQPAIVKELSLRIKNDKISKVTLMRGPTGVGKSTCAKILAMSIVCTDTDREGQPCGKCMHCKDIINENYAMDVSVFDGSADGGKQAVVDFGKQSQISPMYSKASVYIIEESDQLSPSAKNSLLKILERPGDKVYFILLSMVDGGLPIHILDRCQILKFKSFTTIDVMLGLKHILEKRGLWGSQDIPQSFFSEGLRSLAEASRGSLRKAIKDLDKCLAGSFYTAEDMKVYMDILDVTEVNDVLLQLCYLRKGAFEGIENMEVQDLLTLGYSNLSDALRYRIVKEAKNEYYEKETRDLSEAPYLLEVTRVFEDVLSTPVYMKKAFLVAKLVEMFMNLKPDSTKTRN